MGNDFGETTPADILAGINNEIQANKAGKTGSGKFTPNFYLPVDDSVEISDDMVLNGGKIEFADSIEFSDDATVTGFPTGLFQITDDSGGGAGVTQPARIAFCDCGA